jgi:hypothetical protein
MSARIGIGLDIWANRGDALSPEALAWQTNIIANGGTITPTQLAFFDTWFFKPAVAAGNILTELDRLNIYCNLVGSEVAARTNMINLNHFVAPVNSPTFDNTGYRSNGTSSYLNLNYNPFLQGVKLTQNSANIFAVVKVTDYLSIRRMLGAFNAPTFSQILTILRNTNNLGVSVNTTSTLTNTNIVNNANVYFGGRRQNSATQEALINLNITSQNIGSTPIPNFNQFELATNSGGAPLGPYDTMSHLCSGHGSGSLNISGLQTILNNLFTAAGI